MVRGTFRLIASFICCWYEDTRAGTSLKPTRVGIALSYFNWEKLKKAAFELDDEIPVLLAVLPCWHDNQIDQMFCSECSPFHKVEDVTDVRVAEAAEKLMINTDSGTCDSAVDFTQRRQILTYLLTYA